MARVLDTSCGELEPERPWPEGAMWALDEVVEMVESPTDVGAVVGGDRDDPDVVKRVLEVGVLLPVVVLLDRDVLLCVVVCMLVELETVMPVGDWEGASTLVVGDEEEGEKEVTVLIGVLETARSRFHVMSGHTHGQLLIKQAKIINELTP